MKKRFVVVTNPTTSEQDVAFKQWVQYRFTWWHWLDQAWLLVDENGRFNALEIRDKLNELFPGITTLVLEFDADDDTWAGFGPADPNDEKKNMYNWLRRYWNR